MNSLYKVCWERMFVTCCNAKIPTLSIIFPFTQKGQKFFGSKNIYVGNSNYIYLTQVAWILSKFVCCPFYYDQIKFYCTYFLDFNGDLLSFVCFLFFTLLGPGMSSVKEWVSDCCLMPIQQFFSYIMARTS